LKIIKIERKSKRKELDAVRKFVKRKRGEKKRKKLRKGVDN